MVRRVSFSWLLVVVLAALAVAGWVLPGCPSDWPIDDDSADDTSDDDTSDDDTSDDDASDDDSAR